MMRLSDEQRRLLNLTRSKIISNDFTGAYELVFQEVDNIQGVGPYTDALLTANVNPIKYFDNEIPNGYLCDVSRPSDNIVLPEKIRFIGKFAFGMATLNSIIIENKGAIIDADSFSGFTGKIICSNTVKQSIYKFCNNLKGVEFEEL